MRKDWNAFNSAALGCGVPPVVGAPVGGAGVGAPVGADGGVGVEASAKLASLANLSGIQRLVL